MKSRHSIVAALSFPFLVCACAGNSQPASSEPVGQSSAGSSTANSSNGASTTTTTMTTTTANPEPATAETDAGATTAAATDAGAPMPAAAAESPLPPMPTDIHGPPTPWARMNASARGRYMGSAILPAMTSLFQAYDATHFATVNCATCHGPNARATHFHMPNPALPPLATYGTEAANQQRTAHARMFQFMGQRVVPVMATLIGEAPYNPTTHQGFGCFECHTHAAN